MKRRLLWLFVALFTVFNTSTGFAQGRQYIRDVIDRWGGCRNVAITKYNGDLALFGRNAYAVSNCPKGLNEELKLLNDESKYIDDVQLTDNGRWLILYGDNGTVWNDIPSSLEHKLREYNDKQEVITSVTFNDDGDWIVITNNYFSSSDTGLTQWLKEGHDTYGPLWAACITDDALVAVYKEGYKYVGNIPKALKRALRKTKLNVYRVKVSGSAWFFADKNGSCKFSM
jgi:hypothetical protein